jgi:tetratricopeptide (TPR) repeat protein
MKRTTRRFAAAVLALALCTLAVGCSGLKERLALASGNKLYKAQKYDAAVQEYKKILAISPDHWDANYMTAISYLAQYHPGSTHEKDIEYAEQAIQAFDILKLEPPDDATRDKVRGFYVGLLTQTNKLDKAVEYFEVLVKEDPDNPDLLTNAAQMHAKAGNFDRALEYRVR